MNVVVCVKPVKSELVFQNEKLDDPLVMNPYDLYAVEKAIEFKKQIRDCKLYCVCMGAKNAESLLRKTIAMGVDEAILVSDVAFAGSDTVATSYIIAKAIEKIGNVDLIVCGEKTIDGETGQVPYGIAERLHMNTVTKVEALCDVSEEAILLSTKKDGIYSKLKIKVPVMAITSDFRLYHPKISLMGLKKAKRKEIFIWDKDQLETDQLKCGLKGSRTKVDNIKADVIEKESVVLEGSITDKVKKMLTTITGSEYHFE